MTEENLAQNPVRVFEILTKEKETELIESGYFLRDDALIFLERTGLSSAHIENIAKKIATKEDIFIGETPPVIEVKRSRHPSPGGAIRYFYSPVFMSKILTELEQRPNRSKRFKREEIPNIKAELARRIKKRMYGDSK